MANTKKFRITTESHEIFVLRTYGQKRAFGVCRSCDREVEMLTLDQAVWESGLGTNVLVRMAETGTIHTIETRSGHLIICAASINFGSKVEKQQ